MKLIPYKGVKVRKVRPGEIEQVKATIEKIKGRRAKQNAAAPAILTDMMNTNGGRQ